MSQKITVYSMLNCPYCESAKNLLAQRGKAFELIMVDDWGDDQWVQLVKKSGMKTLPIIFSGDRLIGGYTQLAEVDRQDKLASI